MPGCTGYTSQFTRLGSWANYDARFVIVTNGPIDEALAYKAGSERGWSGTPSESSFAADVDAPRKRFRINAFLRDGATVY